MLEITNAALEHIFPIFEKLGATKHEVHRWEFALRINALRGYRDALIASRKPSERVDRYQRAVHALLEKWGKPVGAMGGYIRYEVPAESNQEFLKEQLKLEMDDAEGAHALREHMANLKTLDERTISVDITPIEYAWCGDLIDANEVAILLGYGLISAPKPMEACPEVVKV